MMYLVFRIVYYKLETCSPKIPIILRQVSAMNLYQHEIEHLPFKAEKNIQWIRCIETVQNATKYDRSTAASSNYVHDTSV